MFLSLFVVYRLAADALPENAALVMQNLRLYADSTFESTSSDYVAAGNIVNVLASSVQEHLDKDQNQQFLWHKISTRDGRKGWVLGDGLAIAQTATNLPQPLELWHKKNCTLGAGFENATLWFAAIEGHDAAAYNFEFYGEYYLVITNASGKSVFQKYAGKSAMGESVLLQMLLFDMTGDDLPEIIFEHKIIEKDAQGMPERTGRICEIFQLQHSALRRIFSENLSLLDRQKMPSPTLFKTVELENKTIRIEYIDFLACAAAAPANEDCLEFVTYSYFWNLRTGNFELLYEPSRLAPEVATTEYGIALRIEPNKMGGAIAVLDRGEKVKALRLFDKLSMEKGAKKVESYLFVKTKNGYIGYLPAAKCAFLKLRNTTTLQQYLQNPPLLRTEWRSDVWAVRRLERLAPISSGQ